MCPGSTPVCAGSSSVGPGSDFVCPGSDSVCPGRVPRRDRGAPGRQQPSEPGPAGRGRGGSPSPWWLLIGGTGSGWEAQRHRARRLHALRPEASADYFNLGFEARQHFISNYANRSPREPSIECLIVLPACQIVLRIRCGDVREPTSSFNKYDAPSRFRHKTSSEIRL